MVFKTLVNRQRPPVCVDGASRVAHHVDTAQACSFKMDEASRAPGDAPEGHPLCESLNIAAEFSKSKQN